MSSSKETTPKLYTSHFSVTFIVEASSATKTKEQVQEFNEIIYPFGLGLFFFLHLNGKFEFMVSTIYWLNFVAF